MKRIFGTIIVTIIMVAASPLIIGIMLMIGLAIIAGTLLGHPVLRMEVERSTETDEMDDEKQVVWSTTKTVSRKVWINGELVKDETEVTES